MEALSSDFHLLRPLWLVALLPIAWLLRRWWNQRHTSRSWQAVCDARLLPYLLQGSEQGMPRWPIALAALVGLVSVIALAGPSWERIERPVYRNEAALVVLLDLSRSMDATDLKPTRITRARLKLLDILRQRREGQTALIVFAAQPYTVTPLTVDAQTIASQVPVLESSLMPSQGSRLDLALKQALELLKNGNAPVGEVLLISDGVRSDDARIDSAMQELRTAGYRLSVLGVGTAEGGPISLRGGGFLKDVQGQIVLPQLNRDALATLAAEGGGRFALLAPDESDIDYLFADQGEQNQALQQGEQLSSSDEWVDAGFWLVLLLLPVSLLLFRRGVLWVVVALVVVQPPSPAEAAGDWPDLWQTPDQQAYEAYTQGNYADAQRQFEDPSWRATSAYQRRDYATAAKEWSKVDTATGNYNRGNALALGGQLEEALGAYERTLELDPDHTNAKINHEMVEAKLKELAEQRKEQEQQQEPQAGQQGEPDQQQKGEPDDSQQGEASGSDDQQQSGDESQQGEQQGDTSQSDSNRGESSAEQSDQQAGQGQEPDQPSEGEQAQQAEQQEGDTSDSQQGEHALSDIDEAEQMRQQQLRAIPDNPGGLLRRKFEHLYKRLNSGSDEADPW